MPLRTYGKKMKTIINKLSLFICILILVTQVHADSSNSNSLIGRLNGVYEALDSGSKEQVYVAVVDAMLATVKNAGVSIDINNESTRRAFQRRLSGYLERSVLSKNTMGDVLKNTGVNIIKGAVVNAIINVSSDIVYEQTHSLAVKEGVWLALKIADSAISSKGNPVAALVGQSFILAEVAKKDMEAWNEALKVGYSLDRSKVTSDIFSLMMNGANKYAQGKTDNGLNYLISTRESIKKLINNSGLPEITKQELRNSYLVMSSENSATRIFTNILQKREVRRQQLLEEGSGPEYEALLTHYYPPNDHDKLRNEFDSHIDNSKKLVELNDAVNQKSNEQMKEAEKLQGKHQELSALNNSINSKRKEIDKLSMELARPSGSSSRALRNKYKMIKYFYDKYNGDITKVSRSDQAKLTALSKTLSYSWESLFRNAYSNYDKSERILMLERQIAELSDPQQNAQNEYQSMLARYQRGVDDLQKLIDDVNVTAKVKQGNNSANKPFYGTGSYLGRDPNDNSIFETASVINTSNDFSKDNQNTSVRIGEDASNYITPNVNTGAGDHFGSYQYVAWGQWNSSGHKYVEELRNPGPGQATTEVGNALGGYWVMGQEAYDVPTRGQATYAGELRGDYINAAGNAERGAITGDIGFAVNFGQNSISGNGNIKVHGAQVDTFAFNPVQFDTSMRQVDFANGGINLEHWFVANNGDKITTSAGQKMELWGSLNGKGGKELSGGFAWGKGNDGNKNSGAGVYRAKQQ